MCLEHCDALSNYPKFSNKDMIFQGWKIMDSGGYFPYYHRFMPEKEVWYNADKVEAIRWSSNYPITKIAFYLPAFHLFENRKEAEGNWLNEISNTIIVPVLYSNVVAIGRQGFGKKDTLSLAAKNILFIKE